MLIKNKIFIEIQANSATPVYKQIYLHLVSMIKGGEFLFNDKLPTERDLANYLKVSRGTVKKAYELLINGGFALAEQGSGTFVSYVSEEAISENTKVKNEIDKLLDLLISMGLDQKEIAYLIRIRLLDKIASKGVVKVAGIDCNPEVLTVIKNQLSVFENINYIGFLLNDCLNYAHPENIFKDFDIIFTTTTHMMEVSKIVTKSRNRLIVTKMSLDRETNMKLLAVSRERGIGVITRTPRFAEIIRNNLSALRIKLEEKNYITFEQLIEVGFEEFIGEKKIIIIPPFFEIDLTEKMGEELLRFNYRGGVLIKFNYTLDKSSLINVEEKITNILSKQNKEML